MVENCCGCCCCCCVVDDVDPDGWMDVLTLCLSCCVMMSDLLSSQTVTNKDERPSHRGRRAYIKKRTADPLSLPFLKSAQQPSDDWQICPHLLLSSDTFTSSSLVAAVACCTSPCRSASVPRRGPMVSLSRALSDAPGRFQESEDFLAAVHAHQRQQSGAAEWSGKGGEARGVSDLT